MELALGSAARVAGLALAYWLLGSTALYTLTMVVRMPQQLIRSLTWGPIRRLAERAVASGLAISLSLPAGAGTVDPGYVPIPAGDSPTTTTSVVATTSSVLPSTTADVPGPTPPSPPTSPAPIMAPEARGEVVVKPGDHMWKLAEAHLEKLTGGPVADHVIGPYWIKVIEANRGRIRSGNPDLIFPGEILVLPEWEPQG